jgi:hypothetical protein
MKIALISILLFSALSFEAFAKNCKNSQPCGNSCISWSKTCRIGSSSTCQIPAKPSTSYRSYSAPATPSQAIQPAVPIYRQNVQPPSNQQARLFAQTDAAFVFELPSRSANRIRRLTFDEQVAVYETLGEWSRISAAGTMEEWVISAYLGQNTP